MSTEQDSTQTDLMHVIAPEKARSIDFGQRITTTLTRDNYKRPSWEGCSPLSAVFLHSPPDQIGYIEDPVFQVAIATYL